MSTVEVKYAKFLNSTFRKLSVTVPVIEETYIER
jgi:hypothetical protein